MNKVAEMVANARLKELDRLTVLLTAASTVDLSDRENDQSIKWADVPQALHAYLNEFLYGCTCPIDGIYIWDFKSAINKLAMLHAAAVVPTVAEQPDIVLHDWNVYKMNGYLRLVGSLEGSNIMRWTSPIEAFDLQNMVMVTSMGRQYWLRGAPIRSREHEQTVGGIGTRMNTAIRSWV